MTFEHYTKDPLVFDRDRTYEQRETFKPQGFWISAKGEDDWPSWCRGEQFMLESLANVVEIELDPQANVLVLESPITLTTFHRKYTTPSAERYWSRGYIDWERVASEYDGIVIAPYQWSLRLDPELLWYYTWDVASGCIWNLNAIKEIK